jgi:hypothetical protein
MHQAFDLGKPTKMVKKKQSISDQICELHALSLQRFTIDNNQRLLLIYCHECNSQSHQRWELCKIPA